MTAKEAADYLRDISFLLGTTGVEYLTQKDGEKMREAISTLEAQECHEWISVNEELPDVNPEKIYVDDDCYYQQSDDVLLLMNKEADRIGYSGKYATAKLCVDDSSIDRGYWSLEEMTLGLTWADAWFRIPPDPDQEESV